MNFFETGGFWAVWLPLLEVGHFRSCSPSFCPEQRLGNPEDTGKRQGGPGTEPEPQTGTVGTVRKRNRNRRNRFPGTETGTGTVLSCQTLLKHRKTLFVEEPPEPKTGTDRTFPPPNRNRTEPNRGHSEKGSLTRTWSDKKMLPL